MTTALLLERFKPRAVIFTGVAGGLNLELLPGDLVIGAKTVQHDLGQVTTEGLEPFGVRNPATGIRNPVYFEADPNLLERAKSAARSVDFEKISTSKGERTPKVLEGVIITGDSFVTATSKKSALRQAFNADAVEMEGAAVAQVCYQNNVPCLVIRALSDKSDETAMEDFERFFRVAARNANKLVVGMLQP
jgi:adenosylhomocysteine nucleosidase